MSRTRIELHIEELILEGFAPGDRYRIAAAIERELGIAMAGPGLGRIGNTDRHIPVRDAGSFQMRSSRPEAVGREVALATLNAIKG